MSLVRIELPGLHAGQRRVVRGAGRFNVLQCGRRFGKTTLGIDRLVWAALEGRPAGWFAPTYKVMAEVFATVVRLVAPATRRLSRQERRVELATGGWIDFWSLDDADAGRGRRYGRAVIDEAGIVRDLREAWQESIRPTLADLRGDAWLLGTPKGRNFFHQLFLRGERGEAGWRAWRLPTRDNPLIDPAEIEQARRELPEAVFRQEFEAVPADDAGNPFSAAAIVACTRERLAEGPASAFGIDLAKSHDWTVVCGLDSAGGVCVLERWQADWGQTRRRILDLVGDTPALVDSTGGGDPIVEDLSRQRPTIEGFRFTSASKQQLMEGLAAALQRGEVSFPAGWLAGELESFEYEFAAGAVRYAAPAGMHDDGVCALALAVRRRAMGAAHALEARWT
mgnify:CR=1 FL=1